MSFDWFTLLLSSLMSSMKTSALLLVGDCMLVEQETPVGSETFLEFLKLLKLEILRLMVVNEFPLMDDPLRVVFIMRSDDLPKSLLTL